MLNILKIGIIISVSIFYNLIISRLSHSNVSLGKKILVGIGIWMIFLLFIFVVTTILPIIFQTLPDMESVITKFATCFITLKI